MYKRQLVDTWIARLILGVTVITLLFLLYDLQKQNSYQKEIRRTMLHSGKIARLEGRLKSDRNQFYLVKSL